MHSGNPCAPYNVMQYYGASKISFLANQNTVLLFNMHDVIIIIILGWYGVSWKKQLDGKWCKIQSNIQSFFALLFLEILCFF